MGGGLLKLKTLGLEVLMLGDRITFVVKQCYINK